MHRSDLAGDSRGVVKNTNAQSDIDRLAHQILPIIIEDEFNTQTGVLIGETCQARQDGTYCEAGGRGDAQEAAATRRRPRSSPVPRAA